MFFRKKKDEIRVAEFTYKLATKISCKRDYARTLRNIARKIEAFEEHISCNVTTSNINEYMLNDFIHYLKSLDLKINTVAFITEKLKTILFRISRSGYNIDIESIRYVNIKTEDTQNVYLTVDELSKLNALKLSANIAQIRDLFVIGCFTGMRYSDYSKLSENNFVNNTIVKLTKKTDTRVIIPLHPIISEIIARNNGYTFLHYQNSQQNFNKVIKSCCKKAGINERVTQEYTRGFKKHTDAFKKYELVASHTARRTAATNMYLAGIPVFRIMLITGHKTEEAFFRYIRIRKEENAAALSSHPFFT